MVLTMNGGEIKAPLIAVSRVGDNIKIDDMLCGRSIAITEEQAKELQLALEILFDSYYQQEE